MKFSLPYILLLISVALWCFLIILPPIITHIEPPASQLSYQIYKMFSPVCHQYESRSLHIFGNKLAVCARCSAVYGGFLLGVILLPYVLLRKRYHTIKLWIIFTIPMFVDVLLGLLNVHSATVFTRLLTGLFFGVGASTILAPIIIEAIDEVISRKQNKGVQYESKTR